MFDLFTPIDNQRYLMKKIGLKKKKCPKSNDVLPSEILQTKNAWKYYDLHDQIEHLHIAWKNTIFLCFTIKDKVQECRD